MSLFWILNYILVLVCAVIFSGIIIPKILLISFRKKLFDVPDARKIHHSSVPRLGGIAFKPVILFSVCLALGIDIITGNGAQLKEMFVAGLLPEILFLYCAVLTLYLVGIADDLIGVKYRAKFVVQIICAIMLICGGVWVNNLDGILGVHEIPKYIGYPLTVLLVVFISNAINLIDGIDGLASGLSSVAIFIYGSAFIVHHQYLHAMIAFATWGVLIPFFYYNVFGNAEKKKKIFMGDTGSLTIGILLSYLSIKLITSGSIPNGEAGKVMVTAFAPLIIPCFDVVRVFIHRLRKKQNPFMPDKSHIHHKLLAIGMQQRPAMISIVTISAIFSILNIYFSKYIDINILLVADIVIWTLMNMWLTRKIHSHNVDF